MTETPPPRPALPLLLMWTGISQTIGLPDPGPQRDWAMVTVLLAWETGHGRHGGVRYDPHTQSIVCDGCKAPLFEVAPVEVAA